MKYCESCGEICLKCHFIDRHRRDRICLFAILHRAGVTEQRPNVPFERMVRLSERKPMRVCVTGVLLAIPGSPCQRLSHKTGVESDPPVFVTDLESILLQPVPPFFVYIAHRSWIVHKSHHGWKFNVVCLSIRCKKPKGKSPVLAFPRWDELTIK